MSIDQDLEKIALQEKRAAGQICRPKALDQIADVAGTRPAIDRDARLVVLPNRTRALGRRAVFAACTAAPRIAAHPSAQSAG